MANQNAPAFSDPLLNRFFLSPAEKADKEKGKAIVKGFYTQQTSNDGLSYFKQRNARQIELLLWAKGSQNMQEFLDYMNVSDANKAYVNIDTTQQRIAPQFINTVLNSMAKNEIYPCVKAIDDGSLSEKEQRQLEALFRMQEVSTIDNLQKLSGVQLEPPNVFVPNDPLSAKVYFELEDRLPKEIRFDQMLKKLQKDIQFEKVLNRKGLYDLITLNFEATKIERLAPMHYTVRKCIPTNCVYNFFMNDTGECELTMFGEFYNLKVRDFRSKYGISPERPDGLTEKQIFELAKLSTVKNNGKFNYMWDNQWTNISFNLNMNRPYDDYSILVLDTVINCGEDVYYVAKKDVYGKENIEIKKGVPYAPQIKKDGTIIEQPKPDDVEITKSKKQSWMQGVYAPYGDTLLYWGAPDIIISNYTDTSKSLCPVSVNIPMNDGEYVPSLFERCLEPLREYSITKLKRKQLIASLVPHGIRIDVENARNLDLGNGNSIAWEEVVRIYKQTGHELWSSKGLNPLERVEPPLSNSIQDTSIQKVIELTNVLAGIVAEIRTLIGSSLYLEGGDVGDRTANSLAENQVEQASNVFGYILNGHNQVWEETFYKICLLHWNDIVRLEPESKEDLLNTRFDVTVKMKPTAYQKQILESDIQMYGKMPDKEGNPSLTPKDAFMLREIDNFQLANWYLSNAWDSNRKKAIEDSQRMQQENAANQQQVADANAKEAAALQQQKLADEKEMLDFKYTKEKELAFVNGFWQTVQKGIIPPNMAMPVLQQLMPSISIPLAIENDDLEKGMKAKQMEDHMEQVDEQNQQNGQQQEQPIQPQQQPPQTM